MSSMSSVRSPCTRSIAARIAIAAISSGRVADSFPFGALPTAVRTAETMTGELISVPQYFSLLQQMLHSRQRLLFAAKRLERFPLEIEKILFGRARWARHVAATDDPGEFSSQMRSEERRVGKGCRARGGTSA